MSTTELQPEPVAVKVKALDWDDGHEFPGDYFSRNGICPYIIRSNNGNGFWLTVVGKYFPTVEAAQAAAMADHTEKSLANIELVPVKAQDDLVEALRAIASNYREVLDYEDLVTLSDAANALYLAAHHTRSALVAGDGEPDFGSLPILSLDTPTEPAAIRNAALEESFRAGLEAACGVIDAHSEYDRQLCCDGRECGCYGSTVHQSMQHYIRALQTAPASLDAETRQVLEFYRDSWSYKASKKLGTFAYFPSQPLLDDCGNAARELLGRR